MALSRLILVTGKGGTGKSAVAAALALALARLRPTLLVDLDQRMWAARMLGIESAGNGAAGGSVSPCAIENLETMSLGARTELEAFIERIVPLKSISRRMLQSRTFGYVSTALPGLEAFLMLERLRLVAGSAALEDRFAVVDAPATGSSIELLSVPASVKEIAPVGTLNRLAAGVEGFLADAARFSVVLTLTPHELALREALEAADILRGRLGISVQAAVVNRVAHPLLSVAERRAIATDHEARRLVEWRDEGARFAARARRHVCRSGLKVVELPMLFSPVMGRHELDGLSHALAAGLLP